MVGRIQLMSRDDYISRALREEEISVFDELLYDLSSDIEITLERIKGNATWYAQRLADVVARIEADGVNASTSDLRSSLIDDLLQDQAKLDQLKSSYQKVLRAKEQDEEKRRGIKQVKIRDLAMRAEQEPDLRVLIKDTEGSEVYLVGFKYGEKETRRGIQKDRTVINCLKGADAATAKLATFRADDYVKVIPTTAQEAQPT